MGLGWVQDGLRVSSGCASSFSHLPHFAGAAAHLGEQGTAGGQRVHICRSQPGVGGLAVHIWMAWLSTSGWALVSGCAHLDGLWLCTSGWHKCAHLGRATAAPSAPRRFSPHILLCSFSIPGTQTCPNPHSSPPHHQDIGGSGCQGDIRGSEPALGSLVTFGVPGAAGRRLSQAVTQFPWAGKGSFDRRGVKAPSPVPHVRFLLGVI